MDHGTKLKVIVGPFSSFQLAGLDANVPYAVRVRAKGHDDKFGNFSDVFYTKNFENGKFGLFFIRRRTLLMVNDGGLDFWKADEIFLD